MTKQKEEADKRLLAVEIVLGIISSVLLFALIMISAFVEMPAWLKVLIIIFGFIQFSISVMFLLKIEQVAGYYECAKCGHRYIPTYKSVNLAMHVGRTRYMKCPECNKRSWQKKVISRS